MISQEAYEESIKLADLCGYTEIKTSDFRGYNGSYFVKNGKIWIHDINYLRSKFDNCSDEELERKNYNVEDYYKYGQFGVESFYQSIEDDNQRMDYEYECKQFLAEKRLNFDELDSPFETARSLGFE